MSQTWSSMSACRSPSSLEPLGDREDREVVRVDVVDLVPPDRGGDAGVGQAADRVRRGDGVVAGVLVVVDEQVVGVAVLAPPLRGDVVGGTALDLAGEGQRRAADDLVAVVGLDPDVDVHALAAGGLREADRARARRAPRAPRGPRGVPARSPTAAPGRGRCATRRASRGRRGGCSRGGTRRSTSARPRSPRRARSRRARRRCGSTAGSAAGPSRPTAARRPAAASGAPCRRPAPSGSGAACTAARRAR